MDCESKGVEKQIVNIGDTIPFYMDMNEKIKWRCDNYDGFYEMFVRINMCGKLKVEDIYWKGHYIFYVLNGFRQFWLDNEPGGVYKYPTLDQDELIQQLKNSK